ncbi:MAG: MFS transporter [Saprospiraceae bacterium]|nr:MFS transporter [Saprospiraceae bacterium]
MKNRLPIITLFLANAISGCAQGISMIAIPWYFAKQNNMQFFALSFLVANILSLFWAPNAGVIIDRYNRKNIFLAVNLICGLAIFSIAMIGYNTHSLASSWISLVFIFTFLNYNIHYPNLYAFLQEVSSTENYARVNAQIEIVEQITSMLSGALCALLLDGISWVGQWSILGHHFIIPVEIQAWNIWDIFLLDASTYFVSLGLILTIPYVHKLENKTDESSWIERINTGWVFMRDNFSIAMVAIAGSTLFVVTLVVLFYLEAPYIKNFLQKGATVYANAEMAYSLGAFISGWICIRLFSAITIPKGIFWMIFVFAICLLGLSVTKSVAVVLIVWLLLGLTNSGTRILRGTFMYKMVPNNIFGRVTSFFFLVNILLRIFFIALFSLPFFWKNDNIIYCFVILSAFLIFASFLMVKYTFHFNIYPEKEE